MKQVIAMTKQEEQRFQDRLARHLDELRWLYMELYGSDAMFAELLDNLRRFAGERSNPLKKRDLEREEIGRASGRERV